MTEPTEREMEEARRICKAIITQFGPGLTDHDKAYFVASHLAAAHEDGRREERVRCADIALTSGGETGSVTALSIACEIWGIDFTFDRARVSATVSDLSGATHENIHSPPNLHPSTPEDEDS